IRIPYTTLFRSNAFFDSAQGKARPIRDLEKELAAGERSTPDGRDWSELSRHEQREVIDSYRLVYLSDSPVNWAPGLGTVLANEEVTPDGRSERGNFPVFARNLRQWMMRITAYADRLVDDLELLDWPERVKTMQRNWIGRSAGAEVSFPAGATALAAATTRRDTLLGATYTVLPPERELVERLTASPRPAGTAERWQAGASTPAAAVAAYRRTAAAKSVTDRQEAREKTGVFLGSYAVNPVTGEHVPIFVADYVLTDYGTGAVMAVPGEDQREWDFATKFGLDIVRTVPPPEDLAGGAYTGNGLAINPANEEFSLAGLDIAAATKRVIDWLEENGHGRGTVQYKLRDWLFARQRYWGEPFPIVYDEERYPTALPEDQLPVVLPHVDEDATRTPDPDDADAGAA